MSADVYRLAFWDGHRTEQTGIGFDVTDPRPEYREGFEAGRAFYRRHNPDKIQIESPLEGQKE